MKGEKKGIVKCDNGKTSCISTTSCQEGGRRDSRSLPLQLFVAISSLAFNLLHVIVIRYLQIYNMSMSKQEHRAYTRKSVQFSSSRSKLIYEEEQQTFDKWYSTKEKAQFKQDMLRDVRYLKLKRKVHKQDVNEDDLYRCIGIEKLLLPTAIGQGRVYRSNHVNIILMAQDLGYREEELCRLSQMLSRPSRKRADIWSC